MLAAANPSVAGQPRRRHLNREAVWGLIFVTPAVLFFSVFYA